MNYFISLFLCDNLTSVNNLMYKIRPKDNRKVDLTKLQVRSVHNR